LGSSHDSKGHYRVDRKALDTIGRILPILPDQTSG
jgi:hypothetical protein